MGFAEVSALLLAALVFGIAVLKVVAPKTKTKSDDEVLSTLQKIKAFVDKARGKK